MSGVRARERRKDVRVKTSSDQTPLARKKRSLVVIRVAGVVILLGAIALLWSDPPVLGAVAGAVLLLAVTGFYLVEVQYSRALERALSQRVP
jgi:hypothetical protein